MLQAIQFAGDSWRTVRTTTIGNSSARCGFTNLANNRTVSPTDDSDTANDLQRVQNHEEFLKIDDELPFCNTNDQNYDDDNIEHVAEKTK